MPTIRVQSNVSDLKSEMEYPLSNITHNEDPHSDYYYIKDILKPIFVEKPEDKADPEGFPKNIQQYFWIQPGENDGDAWHALGQLTNKAFFYYTASCDYTGFDCQGDMRLWVSKSWDNIINHAMDPRVKKLYIEQTN